MPRRRATGRRIAILGGGVLALLLLIAVAAGFYARSQLRASRPILSGTVTLAGLSAPAEVERDGLGIPRIKAETIRDGYRVLGYLHAQERFFQMDLQRRQPAGELAALAGAAAAPVDREARLHRMRTRTEQAAEALPAEARRTFEAYREGVAAGLAGLTAPPFEYLLLGQEPAAWRISDSLLTVVAMYFVLNDATGAHEARTAALETALPAELAAFLNPPGTDRDAPLHGEAFPVPEIPGPAVFAATGRSHSLQPAEPPAISGSNSWAVAPRRAAGGAALLASDMHLPLGVPNIWYRAELHVGDARLRGLTLPGVPAVIAGSTGKVAWGFTNSQGDWTDLVELETDPADPLRYRTPDGWRRMEVFEEEIQVAGGPSETLEVHETIWGPVSTEWGRPLAIRWIAHDPEGHRTAYLSFAEASNVEELFRGGWGSGMPPQNLVAVDREGSIGWTIAGAIPRRRGFDGRTPTSWAGGDRAWDGYLKPGEIPAIRNPASGLIWTANNRIVSGDLLDRLGRGGTYAHGERARLIRDRLAPLEAADEAGLLDIQLDDRAEELAIWRGIFLRSLEGASGPLAAEAARVLREGWTGRASVDSAAYPLVRNARVELFRAVYGTLTAPAGDLLPGFSPVGRSPLAGAAAAAGAGTAGALRSPGGGGLERGAPEGRARDRRTDERSRPARRSDVGQGKRGSHPASAESRDSLRCSPGSFPRSWTRPRADLLETRDCRGPRTGTTAPPTASWWRRGAKRRGSSTCRGGSPATRGCRTTCPATGTGRKAGRRPSWPGPPSGR